MSCAYSDVLANGLVFSVFDDDRDLAREFINKIVSHTGNHEFFISLANALINLQDEIKQIDEDVIEQLRGQHHNYLKCDCDECLEDLK